MLKWDEFVSLKQDYALPQFRNQNTSDFQIFRDYYQILDLLTLSENACRYSDRCVSLANLFLVVGIKIGSFSVETVTSQFATSITSSLLKFSGYRLIFDEFLKFYQLMVFTDLIESIKFLSRFFVLKFEYSSPKMHDKERSVFIHNLVDIRRFFTNTDVQL
jgi:hypothetical protein